MTYKIIETRQVEGGDGAEVTGGEAPWSPWGTPHAAGGWWPATGRRRPPVNEDRLAQDRDLFARLQRDGFEGRALDELHHHVWQYGWRVCRKWMKDGTIFERCAERGLWMPAASMRAAGELTRLGYSRDEIAQDTLARALPAFVECLKDGRWDPDPESARPATLRTFFVHQVLYHFRDVYRAWQVNHHRELAWRAELLLDVDRMTTHLDGLSRVELRHDLLQILDGATLKARAICGMILQHDATQAEIARELKISVRAVEGHMRRLREHAHYLQATGAVSRTASVRTTARKPR